MGDFDLLGFFCRFLSPSPSIKPGFFEQVSVAMEIQWVLATVSFSPFSASVVSAIRIFRIVLTVSTVFGKNILCPRAVLIILLIGWCIFVSVLGDWLSKIEWRYLYRDFIFLLVMERNWYSTLFRIALGLVDNIIALEAEACMLHIDLLAEALGVWYHILSMEVMAEKGTYHFNRFTVAHDFPVASGVKTFIDVYGLKCTIGRAYPGATSLFYVMWSFNARMPERHTYHIRVRWILKEEYIMFYNMIASKAYRKEASLSSLFQLCPLQHMAHKFAYVKVCFCEFRYGLNTIVIVII